MSTSDSNPLSNKNILPTFATPWVELGKLEEREKWQALAVDLVETSINTELQDLKRNIIDSIPARLTELKSNVNNKLEQAQSKITNLMDEYRKLLSVDASSTDKKAMLHALQYQACHAYEECIPDMTEEFTAVVNEEIAMEEEKHQ